MQTHVWVSNQVNDPHQLMSYPRFINDDSQYRVPVSKRFLSKFREDVKAIKNMKEFLINAGNSSNTYRMEKQT